MCNDNETANVAMAMVTANNGLAMSMTVTAWKQQPAMAKPIVMA
jgi:hypothetical protein